MTAVAVPAVRAVFAGSFMLKIFGYSDGVCTTSLIAFTVFCLTRIASMYWHLSKLSLFASLKRDFAKCLRQHWLLSAEDLSQSIGEDPPIWGLCNGVGAVILSRTISMLLDTFSRRQQL